MKTVILSMFLAFFAVSQTFSAEFDEEFFPFQIGAYITGKGCVNTVEPPQGVKNDFQLSKMPDIGVKFSYQFQPTSSSKVFAELSYLSIYYKQKLYNNSSINWVNEFHYFNLGVGFEFSSMFLSLNLGFPSSGKWGIYVVPLDLKTEEMNTMFQIRFGGAIPIFQNRIGSLNFLIFGDYFLVGALTQESNYNPRVASLSIGLNYMFNIR
jgi:hypothetical protein